MLGRLKHLSIKPPTADQEENMLPKIKKKQDVYRNTKIIKITGTIVKLTV